jgi:hypothetical protein
MAPPSNSESKVIERTLNWEDFLRAQTDCILLWSLDNGHLNYSGKDLFFHTVDRTALLFFRCILDKQQEGLLVYPANKFSILAPLTLEALYSRISVKYRKKILIINERVAIRDEIKTHFLNFNIHSMILHESFFPVGLIKRNGGIINISRIKKAGDLIEPKLLLSANPQILPDVDVAIYIYAVIVEINDSILKEHLQNLTKWVNKNSIPCIFFISQDPPCEYAVELIKAGISYWGWNSAALIEDYQKDIEIHKMNPKKYETPFCDTFNQIKNRANGITKIIISIEESELNRLLLEARENYKILFQKAKKENNQFAISASKKLLHLIYSFEELTAPLSYVEKEYAVSWGFFPLSQKIESLKSNVNILAQWDSTYSSFYQASIDQLKRLFDYMIEINSGKPSLITQIINEAIKKEKKLAVVSKNAPDSEALKRFLMNERHLSKELLEAKGIFLISIKELNNLSPVNTCVFYGCPRYYQKRLISVSTAETIGFLTYASEAAPLEYMLKEANDVPDFFSFEKRTRSISKIVKGGLEEVNKRVKKPTKSSKPPRDKIVFTKPMDAEIKGSELEPLLETFLQHDFSIDTDYAVEAEILSESTFEGRSIAESEVEAVRLKFGENRIMYVHAEKTVQVYIDFKEEVVYKKAKLLQPNDLLILINNSTSKSLSEAVINKVESHPKMIEVITYQKSWIHYLQRGVKETGDYPAVILHKLKLLGAKSPKTSLAVSHWVNGRVIGPRDKNNIKLIGEIYRQPFLIENIDKIYAAVRRLRGIHHSLSRKLGRLIPKAGVALEQGGEDDTLIDSELDLYLEDFANIITIERVKAVEGPQKVNISILDRNLIVEETEK